MDIQTELSKKRYFITQNELAELFGIAPQSAAGFIKQHQIDTFKAGNKTALSPFAARKFIEKRAVSYPNQVISFQMLKGGATKTSCAFNLAVRLNQYGAKVLVIDLDMQGNLTNAFGVEIKNEPVFYHIAKGEATLEETILPINEGLDLVPSDFENSTLDFHITSSRVNLESFIKNTLKPVKDRYDFIIIDCNPALSALNISIALASDKIIIPVNPDKFSKMGLKKTIDEFERVGKEYNHPLQYNLLFTLFDGREAISQKYLIEYGNDYKDKLIPTVIRKNIDVKNALDVGQSLFEIKRAPAREDFDLVAQEILGFRELGKR